MDEIDRLLARSGAAPGYFALAFSVLSGRLGWVSWVVMATQLALFAAAAWAGWHFYAATETLGALKWGISAATLLLLAAQLKLSLMPVMQANRVLLELRRLERRLGQRPTED